MDDELSSARFATVDEAEFRRFLKEKDDKTRVEQQMELSNIPDIFKSYKYAGNVFSHV